MKEAASQPKRKFAVAKPLMDRGSVSYMWNCSLMFSVTTFPSNKLMIRCA
jgi:hypothetical protein